MKKIFALFLGVVLAGCSLTTSTYSNYVEMFNKAKEKFYNEYNVFEATSGSTCIPNLPCRPFVIVNGKVEKLEVKFHNQYAIASEYFMVFNIKAEYSYDAVYLDNQEVLRHERTWATTQTIKFNIEMNNTTKKFELRWLYG